MILRFEDYTKERLEDDIWWFRDYYGLKQSNTYGKNDELDAFRSAYKQAYITFFYGKKIAEKIADESLKINPDYNNEVLKEASMKIWNERVGREVGEAAKDILIYEKPKPGIKFALGSMIFDKLRNGKMTTALTDVKDYDNFDEIYNEDEYDETYSEEEYGETYDSQPEVLYGGVKEEVEYVQTPCVGTYPVSGYTRKDGTEVSDYMRSCGAKHVVEVKKKVSEKPKKSVNKHNTKVLKGKVATKIPRYSEIYNTPRDLTVMEKLQRWGGTHNSLKIPYVDYYKKSLKLAKGKIDEISKDKHNTLTKFPDFENGKLKEVIRQKIINSRYLYPEQKDYQEKIDNSYIITAKDDSELAKQLINSEKLNKFIKENIDDIKAGKFKDKVTSIEFENPGIGNILTDEGSLYLTIHNADIFDIHVDKYGNIVMDIIDDYNYDLWDYTGNPMKNVIIWINNNAYHQQQAGKLENYILHIPITIPVKID